MADSSVAIGIDLGTTTCSVGFMQDGRVEIVENEDGNKSTPSYVAFTRTGRLVGSDAKDQVTLNPTNTIFGVKGLIGRDFNQAKTYCEENRMPFRVVDWAGKPRILVDYKGEERLLSPEQILAMLLSKMKKMAETRLGFAVTDAVISVPACFNNFQRLATKAAAKIAGLKVLRLINEPTAAAIAFAAIRKSKDRESVMMVDIGGSTCDVSFINISEDIVDVKSTQGNPHFGGQVFDMCLLNHFADEFHKKHGKDLFSNRKAIQRLQLACKSAKENLSFQYSSTVHLECLVDDITFKSKISRATFENLCNETIIPQLMIHVLISAELTADQEIDHIVFVGGSSRVPLFSAAVQKFFKKKLTKTINVNEAVVYGAVVQAALLHGNNSSSLKMNISDVCSRPIDLVPTTEYPVAIVGINTGIPFQKRMRLTRSGGELTFSQFGYHSNYSMREYNVLGHLSEETAAKIEEVKFGVDEDGVFSASGLPQSSGHDPEPTHFDVCYPIMNIAQLEEMATENGAMDDDDRRLKENLVVLQDLETCCFNLQKEIESVTAGPCEGKDVVMQTCNEVLDWLDRNPYASIEEMHQKKTELEELFGFIREQLVWDIPFSV